MAGDTEHDQWNPYTVVQRHRSQWFVFEPIDNTTVLTVSHDAVNLNTIPMSASKDSMASFSTRYVVPEVIAEPDMDTRSAGNPYAHHPNYTTPSQYFDHLGDAPTPPEDVLTAMDIANLKDPFGDKEPVIEIRAPNDVTINKNAFTAESLADLQAISIQFPIKHSSTQNHSHQVSTTETLNKKMLSPESMYELGQVADQFEEKEAVVDFVFREFSPQTLADLREIRNFSQYTDFPAPSKDVQTAMGISPSPLERFQFEWTENVAYGGI